MNIAAMLEPVHKAPCATMSPVSTSPSQQRLPSLMHATSQHAHLPGRASRPLPSMSALPPLSSLHPSPSPPHQVHHIDSGSSTGSYVNAPIQQRPLSAKHHERQHSTDNSTRRDSSASSSHIGATPRHRGKQTKAACIPCRKRKSKCDGIRPSCKSCVGKTTACEYSVNPGVTQQQAVKNQLDAYKHVLNLLRQGNEAECEVLIKQLKAHELLADAVGNIVQEQILASGSSRPGL
ncbi:hypothetical protein D6D12_02060 [Aureobasidium pullulans]|uniref:Zn(2)-C6 fungal-type domain-containing protein n=1 Tax=Aureobasidium pullulans TaxID=5580 RepID=A0AB74K2U5_AURPU|nr:hypothetical protein D6D12_02060 [Aureobasidium pullulans]THX65266.1 hypothetical protein D6D11_00599 [Aureobasidium pullulans]